MQGAPVVALRAPVETREASVEALGVPVETPDASVEALGGPGEALEAPIGAQGALVEALEPPAGAGGAPVKALGTPSMFKGLVEVGKVLLMAVEELPGDAGGDVPAPTGPRGDCRLLVAVVGLP